MAKTYNLKLTEDEMATIQAAMVGLIEISTKFPFLKHSTEVLKSCGAVKAKTQKLINQINDDNN